MFIRKIPVRFDDVDFARTAYFPRFFGYCHEVFEDFFGEEAGVPYSVILSKRALGFPAVHAESDFRSPLRFGDLCRVEMVTEKVGQTSLTCRYALFREEGNVHSASIQLVTVCIDVDTVKPRPIPEDVRQAFERHIGPRGGSPGVI